MKLFFYIGFLSLLSSFSFAQDWQSELKEARSLYQKKQYAAAVEKYKSAQKSAPKGVDLSDEIAQASYKALDYASAEKSYSKSSSKKGNASEKAKNWHNLGNAYMKQKKYQEAVNAYKESLRNNPNDDETRYNLSEALKKLQKQQEKEQQQQNQQNKQQNQQQQKNQPNQNKQQQQNKQQSQQQQNQEKNNQSSEKNEQKSSLNQQKTEKMLDDLTKKELETKKKMGGKKGKGGKNNSGKDW
jgi:tetratricopeptide (TPR) repeat protein